MPVFPLGRIAGAAALEGPNMPHDQIAISVSVAPHQDGAKQGWRCSHSTWSLDWTTLGRFPVGVASRTCLASLSWDIWIPGRQTSWDLSIRRSGFTFRVLRISDLCTLSRHELFAKKTSLPLLGKALFQSLPKIHDHR